MINVVKMDGLWTFSDHLGRLRTMLGIKRNAYSLSPGLYSMGQPDKSSPVLVTANYKLTFDILRKAVQEENVWILVLNTKGVNVWCAAGKGTFGTDELIHRLTETELKKVVDHKTLIIPQLGAPGINCWEVKKQSGFTVKYGPVEAKDLPQYFKNNYSKSSQMSRKSFPIRERLYVGMTHLAQGFGWTLLVALLFVVIDFFLIRTGSTYLNPIIKNVSAALFSLLLGSLLFSTLLPILPGRAFSIKGLFLSLAAIPVYLLIYGDGSVLWSLPLIGKILILSCFTVFQALNLTGSSTYTSLSGVKKEMAYSIPILISSAVIGLVLMITGGLIL